MIPSCTLFTKLQKLDLDLTFSNSIYCSKMQFLVKELPWDPVKTSWKWDIVTYIDELLKMIELQSYPAKRGKFG